MFGTWQLTRVASSPTEASPPARDSRTHSRLGSPSARATAAKRIRSPSVLTVVSITPRSISLFAQRRNWSRALCAPDGDPRRPAIVGRAHTRAVSPSPISLAAIAATRETLAGRIHRTSMLSSATAARVAGAAVGARLADGRLYMKAEHLQKTGSFKPRAALARISSLTSDERRRGAITISAGNAGQAYAWAAREAGVPMTVVMPEGAVASKVAACLEYGADVVLHGAHVGEALAHLEQLRVERDLVLVHPYDDPEVLLGNGSCGLEILEDLPDLDVLVVPVGGGGLIGGVTVAVRETRPRTRVYGVEPIGSDCLHRAIDAGTPVRIQPTSIADGLNGPIAGGLALDVARRYLEGVVLVDDATILGGLRFAIERLKQVLEPAGAAALAAVLSGAIPIRDGDRVAVILSGGNVATDRLGDLLAGAGPLGAPG
jgi:threonine dehydratase